MSKFFTQFPIIQYDLSGISTEIPFLIRNFFLKLSLLPSLQNESVIYYDYQVKDNETIEDVAYKYYGSTEMHWLIMLANNMVDPIYDWVLPYDAFVNYMNNKYQYLGNTDTGINLAQENIQSYILTVQTEDSGTGEITIHNYTIDSNTYNNTAQMTFTEINMPDGTTVQQTITTSEQTFFTYENDLNEAKRNIKLVSKDYLTQIQNEFQALVKG